MKILIMIHRLNAKGGQERSTLEIARRLIGMGHQVDALTYEVDAYLPLKKSYQVLPIPILSNIQITKNLWYFLWAALFMALKGKQYDTTLCIGTCSPRADIRIIQFLHTAYLKAIKAGYSAYPNARSLYSKVYQWIFIRWQSFLERAFIPRSRSIICISESVANDVRAMNNLPPSTQMNVIHHAFDGIHSSGNTGQKRILFVGALERKGVDKALRALAHLTQDHWQCDFVGAGNLPRWQELAKSLGLSDRVFFHGHKPSTPFFNEASIFLFPSSYEPFGLVVTEAVSHGLAPLASQECGAMELWPQRASFMVRSALDTPQQWAASLDELLADDDLRMKVAQEAQLSFAQWNWDKAAHQYSQVIEDAARGADAS